ncbi:MAG TPA: amidohydrolase family protein, partial [Thermoanaerobaculia bacterium]
IPEMADRVLWGTDWPLKGVKSMRQNVEEFLALPLSDAVKRKILFDNAAALFPCERGKSRAPADVSAIFEVRHE